MYGKHAVLAALNNPKRSVKKIFCTDKFFSENITILNKYQPQLVTNEFLNQKIGKDQAHQGIVALVVSIYLNNINQLNFNILADRICILDQITDPQNIGSIIRSAAAFGISKIIMPGDNTPDENATIAKAASGCLEQVAIAKVTNLKSTMDKLKKLDFWLTGLDIEGTDNINDIVKIHKLAIVIGSENKGMRRQTKETCDFLVRIPISDKVESLNASNAASIIFYALQPQ